MASLPPPAVPVTTVRPLLASMGCASNLPGQAQSLVVPCLMLGCISEGSLELCVLIAESYGRWQWWREPENEKTRELAGSAAQVYILYLLLSGGSSGQGCHCILTAQGIFEGRGGWQFP